MLRELVKGFIVDIAMLSVIPIFTLLLVLVLVSVGMPVPPQLYLLLENRVKDHPFTAYFADDVILVSSPNIESTRDTAFEILNVKPEARQWMSELPIRVASSELFAGWYDPKESSVVISQPYTQVFLHEYAHANFERKTMLERVVFSIEVMRLYFDSDTYPVENYIVSGTLALAVKYAKQGQLFDIFQEIYAFIAQSSGGDLNAIAPHLQPYFADYLQPTEDLRLRRNPATRAEHLPR